jgi:hypothetical protein
MKGVIRVKHIKIVNRENKETLPLAAAPCGTANICFFGDWDECSNIDFCIKDGQPPDDANK